jgi:hypothetical protein
MKREKERKSVCVCVLCSCTRCLNLPTKPHLRQKTDQTMDQGDRRRDMPALSSSFLFSLSLSSTHIQKKPSTQIKSHPYTHTSSFSAYKHHHHVRTTIDFQQTIPSDTRPCVASVVRGQCTKKSLRLRVILREQAHDDLLHQFLHRNKQGRSCCESFY